MSRLIEVERQLLKDVEQDKGTDKLLAALDQIGIDQGHKPTSEEVRAAALGSEPQLQITARRMLEEIAAVRYSLRSVLALALETRPVPEYVHLVEIYGCGCVRLVRMLKKEPRDQERLHRYLMEMIHAAHQEVLREWGRI